MAFIGNEGVRNKGANESLFVTSEPYNNSYLHNPLFHGFFADSGKRVLGASITEVLPVGLGTPEFKALYGSRNAPMNQDALFLVKSSSSNADKTIRFREELASQTEWWSVVASARFRGCTRVFFDTGEFSANSVVSEFKIPTLFDNHNTRHLSIGRIASQGAVFTIRHETRTEHSSHKSEAQNESDILKAIANAELGKYMLVYNDGDDNQITTLWNGQYSTKVPLGVDGSATDFPGSKKGPPQAYAGVKPIADPVDSKKLVLDRLRNQTDQQDDAGYDAHISAMTQLLQDGYVTRRQFLIYIHRLGA
jgi:hypothetical protein